VLIFDQASRSQAHLFAHSQVGERIAALAFAVQDSAGAQLRFEIVPRHEVAFLLEHGAHRFDRGLFAKTFLAFNVWDTFDCDEGAIDRIQFSASFWRERGEKLCLASKE